MKLIFSLIILINICFSNDKINEIKKENCDINKISFCYRGIAYFPTLTPVFDQKSKNPAECKCVLNSKNNKTEGSFIKN